MEVLIIGAGKVSNRHINGQRDFGAAVTLFDINPRIAEDKAKLLHVGYTKDLDQAIVRANLIYICTPENTHMEYATQLIRAGKPTFTEKPLAENLADALKLEDIARRYETPFFVGHYVHLVPSFMLLNEMVRKEAVGDILVFNASYNQNLDQAIVETDWRGNVNPLFSVGPHPIEVLLGLAGEDEVATVSAKTDKFHKSYSMELGFRSNITAEVDINLSSDPALNGTGIVVAGTDGILEAHHMISFISTTRNMEYSSRRAVKILAEPRADRGHQVANLMNKYLLGEASDHDGLPNIFEAMPVMRVLDAAQRSIDSHQTIQL